MQKIFLCIGLSASSLREDWNQKVSTTLDQFESDFRAVSYAVSDDDVAPAHLLIMSNTTHPKDAFVSIWVDRPYDLEEFWAAISELGPYQAYWVTESDAIPCELQRGRVSGMCQVALIKKPEPQSREEWLDIWLGSHTQIAIDTQSTFAYRQNVVTTPWPPNPDPEPPWPLMDAIVEENFPSLAMTSREAFFDAAGDPEEFEKRQQIMITSCFRFIDFEAFDCVPTSQYVLSTL